MVPAGKGSPAYDAISSLVTNLELELCDSASQSASTPLVQRSKYNQMVVIHQVKYIPFVGKYCEQILRATKASRMSFQNQRQISLLLVLAGLGVALLLYRLASAGPKTSRRTPIYDAPAEGNAPRVYPYGKHIWNKRVVAVGDLHGGVSQEMASDCVHTNEKGTLSDLNNAQTVLRMAGIIDNNAQWKAGETTLVQTGDMVDR